MHVLVTHPRHRGWRRAWGVASDLLIATALIWTLPLLLGAQLLTAELTSPWELSFDHVLRHVRIPLAVPTLGIPLVCC